MRACVFNENTNIIKYLINNLKMDISCKNNCGENILVLACYYNKNIIVIKFIIEEIRIKLDILYFNKTTDSFLSESGLNIYLTRTTHKIRKKVLLIL